MQRFILEFAEINNRKVVYTFSEENGDISLMPFKGEEEYPVDIDSLNSYWNMVVNAASLSAKSEIQVLALYKNRSEQDLLQSLFALIKKSPVKRNIEQKDLSVLKKFFAEYSKLQTGNLKAFYPDKKVIEVINNGKKAELFIDYPDDINFSEYLNTEAPAKPIRHISKPKPVVKETTKPSAVKPGAVKPQTQQPLEAEHCTGDDVQQYLRERTKDYCDTVNDAN